MHMHLYIMTTASKSIDQLATYPFLTSLLIQKTTTTPLPVPGYRTSVLILTKCQACSNIQENWLNQPRQTAGHKYSHACMHFISHTRVSQTPQVVDDYRAPIIFFAFQGVGPAKTGREDNLLLRLKKLDTGDNMFFTINFIERWRVLEFTKSISPSLLLINSSLVNTRIMELL